MNEAWMKFLFSDTQRQWDATLRDKNNVSLEGMRDKELAQLTNDQDTDI